MLLYEILNDTIFRNRVFDTDVRRDRKEVGLIICSSKGFRSFSVF